MTHTWRDSGWNGSSNSEVLDGAGSGGEEALGASAILLPGRAVALGSAFPALRVEEEEIQRGRAGTFAVGEGQLGKDSGVIRVVLW